MAVAADRTEGEIIIEGVGEDSGESEWWVAGVGDVCVEWGIGKPGGLLGLPHKEWEDSKKLKKTSSSRDLNPGRKISPRFMKPKLQSLEC